MFNNEKIWRLEDRVDELDIRISALEDYFGIEFAEIISLYPEFKYQKKYQKKNAKK